MNNSQLAWIFLAAAGSVSAGLLCAGVAILNDVIDKGAVGWFLVGFGAFSLMIVTVTSCEI